MGIRVNSRHSQSNVIFAQKPRMTKISLAEIHYFTECTFQPNVSSTEYRRVWIVALKMVYGTPLPCMVRTFCCTQCTEVDFIPFNYIKERCVFIKTLVNFGRYLGNARCHNCNSNCLQIITFIVTSVSDRMAAKARSILPSLSLTHIHVHTLCVLIYL